MANAYRIGLFEVTNDQYAEFMNATAASDPNGLFNTSMMFDNTYGGIDRSGSDGSFTYAAKTGFENKPVVYVSWYDTLRFSNWLHNGQPTGAHNFLSACGHQIRLDKRNASSQLGDVSLKRTSLQSARDRDAQAAS